MNALGYLRMMFAVEDIDDTLARLRPHGAELVVNWRSTRISIGSVTSEALRGSSSGWPSRSASRLNSYTRTCARKCSLERDPSPRDFPGGRGPDRFAFQQPPPSQPFA